MQQAYTYGMLGDTEHAKDALQKLMEEKPGFSIAHAVEFHRKYHFQPEVIDKIVEGLRRAGLPEGSATAG